MNLIEQLGLEKCQQIVDGAPEEAEQYDLCEEYYISIDDWSDPFFVDDDMCIEIKDLRTAIANHEKCQHEWNETTSNGDAYRFFVCKHCDSTQNYVPFKDDNPSHFDHCSDIKNHISPLTGVIER